MTKENKNKFVLTYILKLEDECWYVGISTVLNDRMRKHFTGRGANWTKLHKPIEIHRVFIGDREKELTLKMKSKYGSDKVRGDVWLDIEDSEKVCPSTKDEPDPQLSYEEVADLFC